MTLTALQDLFRRYREKATGVWKLGQEPGRTIYFDYGDAVFAQSTHLQDRLTYILVERGKVTQAQMDYALANLKTGLSIGKNLIEMGFITQRDLLEVAKAQVERIICGSLATANQEPLFEAKDLDANVVRLPLSTAQVFLTGVLGLQNREGLLELLGPLNQVVVLQSRGLMDLTLPPDLAKLPPLLDGTHTLLELSRESLAEPVRLGAFALFLREMGWARLHEMPPLDRHALDLAFTPEPEPLSAPLSAPEEVFPETVPSLFTTIQEAGRLTTNLEHLSLSLDADPVTIPIMDDLFQDAQEPDPLYLPERLQEQEDAEGPLAPELASWTSEAVTGQAELPTPAMALPPLAIETELEAEEEPRVLLQIPLDPGVEAMPVQPPAAAAGPSRHRLLVALLALLVVVAGGVFLRQRRGRRIQPAVAKVLPTDTAPKPVAAPAPPVVAEPAQAVPEVVPEPEPAKAEPVKPAKVEPVKPAKVEPVKPAKAEPKLKSKPEAKPVGSSLHERLVTIAKGDLGLAIQQGQAKVKETPANHWALRLEIACQGDTIRRVTELFKGEQPDLFLLPITLRDGRTCYQVLYGHFPSREAAEKQLKRLPLSFRGTGNQPKPFRFSDIPKVQ